MKTKGQESRKTAPASARSAGGARAAGLRSSAKAVRAAEQPRKKYWRYALALAGVLIAAFEVYGPSLNGPFLFDDNYLPFCVPNFRLDMMKSWLVGLRFLVMFSYWINYRISVLESG